MINSPALLLTLLLYYSFLLTLLLLLLLFNNTAFAQVSPSDRQEYEEARETVPGLLEVETPVPSFLRIENYDPIRTAATIAMYWKVRKILFQERWLLPLNQTGTGALSMTDIEFLRSGYYVVFPRGPGRSPLLLMDESRLPRAAGDSNFRILFYLDYLYMEYVFRDDDDMLPRGMGGSCIAETRGVTVLHVVSSRSRPAPDTRQDVYAMCKKVLRIARESVFHVAQAFEDGKGLLVDYLGYQTSRAHEFRTQVNVNRIAADSMAGTLQKLEAKGFSRQHFPHSLGGDYDYKQFGDWIRMRTSVEDMMSSTPIMANRLSTPATTLIVGGGPLDAPVQRRTQQQRYITQQQQQHARGGADAAGRSNINNSSEGVQDEETKALLARQRNALYSRRSNKKKDLLVLSLQDQQGLLKARNEKLRTDNARLEYALVTARQYLLAYKSSSAVGNNGATHG